MESNLNREKCWMDDHGIVHMKLKTPPGTEMNLKTIKSMAQSWLKVVDGGKHPHLFDTRNNFGVVTFNARKYLSRHIKIQDHISMKGFIVDSLANRLLINFYLKIAQHPYPAKQFSTEEEAITWLKHDK